MTNRPAVRRGMSAAAVLAACACACAAADRPKIPRITQLRDLHLVTEIAADGVPRASIVTAASGRYDAPARRIAEAVRELCGAALPVVKDTSPAAALPPRGHVIVLGNRSTSALIGALYDRIYTLLDLRYPGAGGSVVRTGHDCMGSGFNVVFVGGSDDAGVARAADVLIARLRAARKGRSIRLGRLAEIRLGGGLKPPRDVRDVKIWDASAGYGSTGYFGWNSLSKRMALYHMTGDAHHAREFLRLAFPDAKARREIAEIDGERVEDKDHPLSGPYHYNAHMMICLWELIEPGEAFGDADRLRITNAFARQLDHWAGEWVYAAGSDAAPRAVGSRHGQWAAISLYCLARYFQTHYPAPIWKRCGQGAERHFHSLHKYAWVSGENDNLFWYNTAIAPVLSYMVLTGDRVPRSNGVLATLLRGQEALISGRMPDWALRSASIGYLHKAAYLTGDGRWLTYRDRTGVDTGVFRVGQSFWPDERLRPAAPNDLVGTWTAHRLSEPKWRSRKSGLPHGESFEFASFRSEAGAGGDFVLLDGFNGASRNPYHALAVLELRLAGWTLLRGYDNQVIVRADGLMEPRIAMNAALRRSGVVGETAFAVGEVPRAAFANWRRTLIQRTGRYAVIADELTFRQGSENAQVSLKWQSERWAKRLGASRLRVSATRTGGPKPATGWARLCASQPMRTTGRGSQWTMQWLGKVAKGERKTFVSLLAMERGGGAGEIGCFGADGGSAVLALPEPARVCVGAANGDVRADLAVLAGDHVFALGATRVAPLVTASAGVDVDWDLTRQIANVAAAARTRIGLALEPGSRPALAGRPLAAADKQGMVSFDLPAGRHVIRGAAPRRDLLARHREDLARRLKAAAAKAASAPAEAPRPAEGDVPVWQPVTTGRCKSAVAEIEVIGGGAPLLAVAAGKAVHRLGLDGRRKPTLAADGPVRVLRWWPEARLLLAGCADEKVIAFDEAGRRAWVFVSQMDPAVLRAGKTYWFKSARGHEGIHGLHTGRFIDDKPNAFVGSACTLEILDERGKLVRRMPQFWGKVSTFRLVEGPGGTTNLLAARKYNGRNTVAIVNSRKLDPTPRGFIAVPSGHTYMPGWSSMNRHHLFWVDLDGDGAREVVSEINGTWNRVCVWSLDGKAKFAANLGPGARIPARTVRDLDVCDLDGDGRMEIVAATSYEMVVALDARCRRIWSARLGSAANVLACIRPAGKAPAWVVLGCDDGQVRVLDAAGRLVRRAALGGRPVAIRAFKDARGRPLVAFGTQAGRVAVFAAP